MVRGGGGGRGADPGRDAGSTPAGARREEGRGAGAPLRHVSRGVPDQTGPRELRARRPGLRAAPGGDRGRARRPEGGGRRPARGYDLHTLTKTQRGTGGDG